MIVTTDDFTLIPALQHSCSGVEVVTLFVVLREVEPFRFLLGGDAEADDLIDKEEQDESSDDGDDPGDGNAGELIEQLTPVSVEYAGGDVFAKGGVDQACGEDAGEQRADGSTGSVDTESVKGIVVSEAVFDFKDDY